MISYTPVSVCVKIILLHEVIKWPTRSFLRESEDGVAGGLEEAVERRIGGAERTRISDE